MLSLLGFFFSMIVMFALFVVVIGMMSILRLFLFFRGGSGKSRRARPHTTATTSPQRRWDKASLVKKMFAADKGEYVDYEEVPQEKGEA